jgi:hypothetical protein
MTTDIAQLDQPAVSRSSIERKLRAAWHKERRYIHFRGVCHLLLWLVAFIFIDFFVDWLFRIPGTGRVALVGMNVVVLAVVAWHYWLRHLRRYDPVRVALQVEKRHPGLSSLLVSYVQLRHLPAGGSMASPRLIEAMRGQAINTSGPMDFKQIISYVELKRIVLASVAVVIFAGAVSVRWDDHFRILIARLIDPKSTLAYPTRTQIEPLRHLVVRQGDPVNLEIRVKGMTPAEGSLFVQPEGGEWERLPVALVPRAAGDPLGTYAYSFQSAYRSFHYYARVGDARSERYRVTVIPPPRIEQAKLHLEYPQYTNKPPRTAETLNVEVPEGTKITWELTCSPPISAGSAGADDRTMMLIGDRDNELRPHEVEVADDGRLIRVQMMAQEAMAYRFQFRDREHGFIFREETRHFVHVTPDAPPDVEILKPHGDAVATVQKTLEVEFRATDDYGIARGWMVYSFNEGPERRLEIPDYAGGTATLQWALRSYLPEFADGDLLVMTYAVEVEDNYPGKDGPHRSRSGQRTLQIVSIAEYRQYMLEKMAAVMEELKAVHESEQDASREVKDIGSGERQGL